MTGPDVPADPSRSFRESRLDELREEARRAGPAAQPAEAAGYYGRPVLKPPVWTWEVPAYFFVGGMAGMAAVIALAGLVTGQPAALVRAAGWIAAAGAVVSPVLLVLDLGRPERFLNMLRVFKWRSAMSVGAWTLALFGPAALAGAVLLQWGDATGWLTLAVCAVAAASGAVLATYTGVLLGATAIPVWSACHRLLPVHFGVAGLGTAAAALELLGHRAPPLDAIGLSVAALETGLGLWTETKPRRPATRALYTGRSGLMLRASALLLGPLPLTARLIGWVPAAAVLFMAGALLSRFAWLAAGRASALDAEAVLKEGL